jgi:hypothetical protein
VPPQHQLFVELEDAVQRDVQRPRKEHRPDVLTPGAVDTDAFVAGLAIAEHAVFSIFIFLLGYVLLRKLLAVAGW